MGYGGGLTPSPVRGERETSACYPVRSPLKPHGVNSINLTSYIGAIETVSSLFSPRQTKKDELYLYYKQLHII